MESQKATGRVVMCKTPKHMVRLVNSQSDTVDNMTDWCQDYVDDLNTNRKILENMILDTFGCSVIDLRALLANASALTDDCEQDWKDRQL